VVFYYFSFADTSQSCESLLNSLIVQLADQHASVTNMLEPIRIGHSNGGRTPELKFLIEIFRKSFFVICDTVYVVIDALDECPHRDRSHLLKFLNDLMDWNIPGLHLLMASRVDPEIQEHIASRVNVEISIEKFHSSLDRDISVYVDEQLNNDRSLREWGDEVHSEIKRTLLDGANGM